MSLSGLLLIAAALTVGLSAGLLFAYAVSVNPGLARLDDLAYLSAMQHINDAIQNALFFVVYFSPVLLLPVCSWQLRHTGEKTAFYLVATASVLYIAGVVGVTIAGNVPLNEALRRFAIGSASPQELQRQRARFEIPWNQFHNIRTVAAVLSTGLLLWALALRPLR